MSMARAQASLGNVLTDMTASGQPDKWAAGLCVEYGA